MMSMTRRFWLAASAAGAGVLGGLLTREARSDGPSSRERIRARYFPDVVLTTHEGKQVRFYEDLIKDKIVVINLMYTRCADGTCPVTTANLVRVQKLLKDRVGRDIFMYSITLTPEHDTPEVLQRYAKSYRVGPGWLFLTGQPADIEVLRRKLGFTDPDPARDANKVNHIGMVRYGNEPDQLWAAVPGMAKPEWIAESILWADFAKPASGAGCATCPETVEQIRG
jgi:protein SCO1/2